MRITYFAHSIFNRGGDKVILAHLGHLAESGHHITIRTNTIKTIYSIHPAIVIEKIRLPSMLGTITEAIFRKQSVDFVIATIIPTAVSLFVRNRRKVVYLAQEYDEVPYKKYFLSWFIRYLYLIGMKGLKIRTIAVSRQLAETLEKQYGTHVETVTNGIDMRMYYHDPDRSLLDLKGQFKAIVLFSRNDFRKGFDLAIKVVEKIMMEFGKSFALWIVGEQTGMVLPDIPYHDFGFVDDVQMRKILSSADVLLYPSRTDGYGLIVAEAFACRCPVVTTSAVPIAEDGVNALVSKPGCIDDLAAKVMRLLEDKELGDRLAERGYGFISQMSLESATMRFEEVLTGSCGQ